MRTRIDDLKIFSDGSGEGDNIRAAAVIFNIEGHLTHHYHLGSITEHTVFEGELIGVLLALNLIWHHPNNTQVLIGLDNQSAIRALMSNKKQPGQYIIDAIHKELRNLKKHHSDLRIHIEWTPGHSGVDRNKHVDSEVKKASAGLSSRAEDLPLLLHSKLPTSIAALKATRKRNDTTEWIKLWAHSPHKPRLARLDPSLPSQSTFRALSTLTRPSASILVQLQTGDVVLNMFLKKIKAHDSALCAHCGVGETVAHFLFFCKRYVAQRLRLKKKVGQFSNSTKALLSTSRNFKHTLQYIASTNRFPQYRIMVPE